MEELVKPYQGEITIIAHKGGTFDPKTNTIVGGEVVNMYQDKTSIEEHNLIVNKASTFMAKRMHALSGSNLANGIQYLAVGVGYGTGTPQAPQAEDATAVKLRNELYRKAITNCTFVDSSGNTVSESNIVQYIVTFNSSTPGPTEADGAIVEFGLFGGNATATKDSGYMFNHKVIPVWNKTSDIELTISWKITF